MCFAKKFGIILKDERYLEWEIAVVKAENSFEKLDVELYKNKDGYYDNFDILDELLLKICPNILPLQYKLLYKKCVDFEVYYQANWYQEYNILVKRCNIEELYDFLIENKLFNEGDL